MAKTRLLLADDDFDHRDLLVHALVHGRDDVDVLSTETREDFLRAAREGAYECAILDYNMPPHTAPAIVADLRLIQPGIPIIVVSASADQQVAIESFRTSGVIDFIPKEEAMHADVLWGRVQTAIADARKHRNAREQIDRRLASMRRIADTDCLTGLFNRGYFQRVVRSHRVRGDRRRTCACVMIDLDHFKRINDSLGHDAGDAVLVHAASLMRRAARPGDVLVRWGGEEFLALLPSTSLTEAWSWADDLRRTIAHERCSHQGADIRITASAGTRIVPSDQLDADAIIGADHALYLAKEFGRNQVCTLSMASAIEAADSIQADAGTTLLDHFAQWRELMKGVLGPVQAEHIGPHGETVARIAEDLGHVIGLSEHDLATLGTAARLHDIGKAGIPEEILAKAGRLTIQEKRFVDIHAGFGARVALALGADERVSAVIAAHHDRFDRPASVAADLALDSLRLARILSVADAIVTMRTERPYASARTATQTLAEIRNERGRQFDPLVVDAARLVDPPALCAG